MEIECQALVGSAYASSSSPKPTLCPPAFKFRASNNADRVNLTPKTIQRYIQCLTIDRISLPDRNNCWKDRPT